MPYALLATEGRLFADFADGQIWESGEGGDSWAALRLEGDALGALVKARAGRGGCVYIDW